MSERNNVTLSLTDGETGTLCSERVLHSRFNHLTFPHDFIMSDILKTLYVNN